MTDNTKELEDAIEAMLNSPDGKTTLEVEVGDPIGETEQPIEKETEVEAPVEKEDDTPTKPTVPVKDKSRAQDRIRELANEKRKLADENETLKRRSAETEKLYAEKMVAALESQLAIATRAKINAVQENDGETLVKLDEQITELREQIANLKGLASREVPETKAQADIPTEAQLWSKGKEFMIDNSVYATLPKEKRIKIAPMRDHLRKTVQLLLNDGWDVNSPLFYEEIDIRMSIQFPNYDLLASEGVDALEYKEEAQVNTPDASAETKKPDKSKSATEKAKSLPIPAITTKETAGKRKVSVPMDTAQYRYWEKYLQPNGITLGEYSKEIAKFEEKNRK